ncbi:MAG: sigma-70 family RNA polymerase sigma factor [Anaerolineaceae bacterium]|nr:sigma-70 family RNA polymerase sigma factor [Anaerolineaceae bacterium]
MNTPEETTDLIIERAINGDDEAFSLLYQENLKKIYNYIYYRTGNSHDAEDLTARVFQRALNHISKYKKTNVPFSAWLYRIAHNLVANWHRDNSRRKEVPLEEQTELRNKQEIPEKEIEAHQEIEFLLKSIHRLSHDRQMVLILKYVEDLSNKEIGDIMRKSEGAIKSLYHRTLLELREHLEISGEDENRKL